MTKNTKKRFKGVKNSMNTEFMKLVLGTSVALTVFQAAAAPPEKITPFIKADPSVAVQAVVDGKNKTKVSKGVDYATAAKPSLFKLDIRNLPASKKWLPGDPVKVANPRHINHVNVQSPVNTVIDNKPLQTKQRAHATKGVETDLAVQVNESGFEFNGVNPPDPTGEVGENYYIHAINSPNGASVQIFNKADGTKVGNAFDMDQLATEGDCASGLGDPIIVYDELAKRWLLSEFSSSGNKMCVYVSQTSDPVAGGWYSYAFQAPGFPDYPKYSIWNDSYFISSNEESAILYAVERDKLLNGEEATLIRKALPRLAGFGFQSITPIDVDGIEQPDANSAGMFIRHNDDELHNSGSNDGTKDFLEIWQLTPDYTNVDNTVLEGPINIDINEFSSDFFCPDGFGCLQQKDDNDSLSALDPLKEVVNYKAQYRRYLTHQSIVGSFVSKQEDNTAQLRWFELRNASDGWELFDEGVVDGSDQNSRFMAGAALDGDGNMALAYMITGADKYPGIGLTGRRWTDDPGTVADEISLFDAEGGISTERAGDYSHMSVDPIDHCTFWFTTEHGAAGDMWGTRVASFKYPDCSGFGTTDPLFTASATNKKQEICMAETPEPITISLKAFNGFDENVNLSFSGLPTGITGTFSQNPLTANTTSDAQLVIAENTPAEAYSFSILAENDNVDNRTLNASLRIVDASHVATLMTPANGADKIDTAPTLTWEADGYVKTFVVEIATDAEFTNLVATGTTTGNAYRPSATLEQVTTYYWRVKSANACGDETSEVFSFITLSDKDKSTELTNDEKIIISGATDSFNFYYVDVPEGADSLTIATIGADENTGDLDIYLTYDSLINSAGSNIICDSTSATSDENCHINAPDAGTYFVTIHGYSAYENAELHVLHQGQGPVIEAQSELTTAEDTAIEITTESLTITNSSSTEFTLSLNSGENYTFDGNTVTPAENFEGILTVGVTVSDGGYPSNVFELSITVTPVNDAPEIKDVQPASMDEDTSLEITQDLLDIVDPDNTEFTLTVSEGENYTLDGATVTPAQDFFGELTVSVMVNDGELDSEATDITVTVNAINDAPVAVNDSFTVQEGSTNNTFSPLTNDTDVDPGTVLSLTITASTSSGTLTVTDDTVSYTPNSGFNGSDSFTYQVSDGSGGTATATVAITVTAKPKSSSSTGFWLLLALPLLFRRKMAKSQ